MEMPVQGTVYVVMDTKGNGRVVGVFEHDADAANVVAVSPQYYRIQQMGLNEVNPDCVRWIQDEQGRQRLTRLSTQIKAVTD